MSFFCAFLHKSSREILIRAALLSIQLPIHFSNAIHSNPPFSHPFCHVNLDMDPKCLRFLSVAQECTVLPRRGYFFASCCLVKTLACQVSEVSWRMQQTLYGFTRDTKSGTSQGDAKYLQPWNCGIMKYWEVKSAISQYWRCIAMWQTVLIQRWLKKESLAWLIHMWIFLSIHYSTALEKPAPVWSSTHQFIHLSLLSWSPKKAIWKVTSKVWEHISLETKDAVRLSLSPEQTLSSPKLQHTLINCNVSCSPQSKSSCVGSAVCQLDCGAVNWLMPAQSRPFWHLQEEFIIFQTKWKPFLKKMTPPKWWNAP